MMIFFTLILRYMRSSSSVTLGKLIQVAVRSQHIEGVAVSLAQTLSNELEVFTIQLFNRPNVG